MRAAEVVKAMIAVSLFITFVCYRVDVLVVEKEDLWSSSSF